MERVVRGAVVITSKSDGALKALRLLYFITATALSLISRETHLAVISIGSIDDSMNACLHDKKIWKLSNRSLLGSSEQIELG